MSQNFARMKDLTMLKLAVATILVCILIDEASAAALSQADTAAVIEQVCTV